MTKDQKIWLTHRVNDALGIRHDVPTLILVADDGAVRRVLTGFAQPVEGWANKLRAAGLPVRPDSGKLGGDS